MYGGLFYSKKKASLKGDSLFFQNTCCLFFLLGSGFLGNNEVATSFKFGDLLSGDLDSGTGLRVLGGASFALDNAEGTEADEAHLLAFVQLLGDGGSYCGS